MRMRATTSRRTSPLRQLPTPHVAHSPNNWPIKAIKGEQDVLRVCLCGSAYVGQGRYCSERCRARSAYRMKAGIPLDAAPYGVRASA